MKRFFLRGPTVIGLLLAAGVCVASQVEGQQSLPSKVKLTAAELHQWVSQDGGVTAGINHANGCAWIVVGSKGGYREQYWNCPSPFGADTSTGSSRVVGDQLCSKFDKIGNGEERCWDVYRVGENRYEGWRDGKFQLDYYKLK